MILNYFTYIDVVMKVISNLNTAKSCQINDVPTKIIIMNKDIFANFVTDHFNYRIAYCNTVLLIAKFYEYSISLCALNIISSYLKHRTQQTNSNDCFSVRLNIECDVPQGSVLGPLVFNINMSDLFYECEGNHIANYADQTTPIYVLLTLPRSFLNYWLSQQKFIIGLAISYASQSR